MASSSHTEQSKSLLSSTKESAVEHSLDISSSSPDDTRDSSSSAASIKSSVGSLALSTTMTMLSQRMDLLRNSSDKENCNADPDPEDDDIDAVDASDDAEKSGTHAASDCIDLLRSLCWYEAERVGFCFLAVMMRMMEIRI
jgi:hypothetical protein